MCNDPNPTARPMCTAHGFRPTTVYTLYPCLRSHSDWTTQDQLSLLTQRLNGWFSVRSDVIDYWVPEDRAYMLYMIDANLTREPTLDYIV